MTFKGRIAKVLRRWADTLVGPVPSYLSPDLPEANIPVHTFTRTLERLAIAKAISSRYISCGIPKEAYVTDMSHELGEALLTAGFVKVNQRPDIDLRNIILEISIEAVKPIE